MLRKTITYKDYDGVERTEDFFFNLSMAEFVELELTHPEGFAEHLQAVVESNDGRGIIDAFKRVIKMSYGVKSDDGKRFIKSDELFEEFAQTEAYSELFVELATEASAAVDFINGIAPQDLVQKAQALQDAREQQGQTQQTQSEKKTPRAPQDRLPKKAKEERRTITTAQEPSLEQAEGDTEPEKTHYTLAELSVMPREKMEKLQGRLDGDPIRGFTLRPPHESGPGFQQG